jgi:pimeloyl-ACP methyl ester carboxylesterase
MRDYPEGIRSVVLDSLVPLEVEFQVDVPNNYNRSLEILFADCAANEACAAAYPDLEQVYYDTIEALNETPARFDSTNPLTGTSYENIRFDGYNFSTTIFQLLYDATFLPAAPQFIYEVAEGDYENLSLIFGSLLASQSAISTGMNFAFNCHEEFPFIDLDEMIANFATFPGYTEEDAQSEVAFLAQACEAFESGAAPALEDEPISSDLPTLVTAGEYDPITPPAFAEQVAANLANSTYIEFPASGHGPTGGVDCAQGIAAAYIVDPSAELDTACVSELEVNFVVPGGSGEVTDVSFEPLDLTEFNINGTTIVPEGWTRTVAPGNILVYARGESALDQTALTFIPLPMVTSVQQVVTALSVQFEISDEPDQVLTTDDYEWSVFGLEVQGFPGYLAVTTDDDGAIVILFLGDDATRDSVLIPLLEAFTPAE